VPCGDEACFEEEPWLSNVNCHNEEVEILSSVVKGIEVYGRAREEAIAQKFDDLLLATIHSYIPVTVKLEVCSLRLHCF
jgi:hypothetical protein